MGQKVHPVAFRLGITKDWLARWQDEKNYAKLLHEDLTIRQLIQSAYGGAGTSKIEIERGVGEVTVTIYTSRPGVVIGRGGSRIDEMRNKLESLTGKKVRLNIQEIREPELDAYLVARNIADQLERRVSYRRAMKQAISRSIMAGAKGIKVSVAGRLGGVEIARRVTLLEGSIPLHTIIADIDYGFAEAHTTTGKIGVKVWIYKGDLLPELAEVESMEATPPKEPSE